MDVVLGEIDLPDSVGAVVRRAAPRLVRDGLAPAEASSQPAAP